MGWSTASRKRRAEAPHTTAQTGAILTDVKKPLLHGGLSALIPRDQSRLTMCASGATMGLCGSTVNRHKLRQQDNSTD